MSEGQFQNKRRNYFIDHKFQTNFILKFCFVIILSSLVIGVVVFYLARTSTTVAIENTQVTIKATSDFILPILSITLLSVTACTSIVVLIMMLFISHRIAGPAYRLKREVNALKDGRLNLDFHMRRKDQLMELAQAFEELAQVLKGKHQVFKEKSALLARDLERLKVDPNSEEFKLARQHLRELREKLDYFKL